MQRFLPLFYLLCTIGCTSNSSESSSSEPEWDAQPNILWLVAEDLSPIIPPFGDSTVTTPNLSRLAAEGVRYTHAFSPSGVCKAKDDGLPQGEIEELELKNMHLGEVLGMHQKAKFTN